MTPKPFFKSLAVIITRETKRARERERERERESVNITIG